MTSTVKKDSRHRGEEWSLDCLMYPLKFRRLLLQPSKGEWSFWYAAGASKFLETV